MQLAPKEVRCTIAILTAEFATIQNCSDGLKWPSIVYTDADNDFNRR